MLRYVLLALMRNGSAAHGYALMKAYEERSGMRVSIGNVYRELQWLLGHGLITAAPNPPGADPRRAPYAINQLGREALDGWLTTPVYALMRAAPDVLCHRMALAGDVEPAQMSAFLDDLNGELWAQSKDIERERAMVNQRARNCERTFPARAILLERRARHLAADIEMVDQMRSVVGTVRKRRGAPALQSSAVSEGSPGKVSRARPRGDGTGA